MSSDHGTWRARTLLDLRDDKAALAFHHNRAIVHSQRRQCGVNEPEVKVL